jgi:PilZ domain-containing protein
MTAVGLGCVKTLWEVGLRRVRTEGHGTTYRLAQATGNRQAAACQLWDAGPMYPGIERRAALRCLGPRSGTILLKADSIIECTVCDFSLGGVCIELPAAISILSREFDLTFGQFTRRCETVWRKVDRMGLKVRSTRFTP